MTIFILCNDIFFFLLNENLLSSYSFLQVHNTFKSCLSVMLRVSVTEVSLFAYAVHAGVLQDLKREDGDWSCCRKVPHSAVDQGGCVYNGPQWRPAW